jgi:hypothetical protein
MPTVSSMPTFFNVVQSNISSSMMYLPALPFGHSTKPHHPRGSYYNLVDYIFAKMSPETVDHADKMDPYSLLIEILHHQHYIAPH